MEATLIPIEKIEVPEKFRREKTADAAIEDKLLQQSIKVVGLRFPIRVKEKSGGYILIDGYRRMMATKALRNSKVPAYVIPEENAEDIDVLRFQSNVQRENLKPMDEAKLIKALIVEDGIKRDDVAKMVGKEPSTIDRYLDLIKVSERWQKLVNDGVLSMWDVKPVAALTPKGQRNVYDEIKKRDIPFSRDVIQAVASALSPVENPEFFVNPKLVAAARINEKIGQPVHIKRVEGIAERKAMTSHYKRTLKDYEEKVAISLPVIRKILNSKDVCETLFPSTLKGFREVIEQYPE